MPEKHYSISIIGSTDKTVSCAQIINSHSSFSIPWILTPGPKPIGRDQAILANPLHQFADQNQIPAILLTGKIDQQVREQISKLPRPDLILVVDFGYMIPDWLLQLPKIAPLNIHPSKLPKWRGSSPGQFIILFGDKDSAITLMKINSKMDQGDIIAQIPFSVIKSWNQEEYYKNSFNLINSKLTDLLLTFINDPSKTTIQPDTSSTPLASLIKKEDAFLEWNIIKSAMEGQLANQKPNSKLLALAFSHHQYWTTTINLATKAFNPWPVLWTIVPTQKGKKRMKILETKISEQKLVLVRVQIEGQQPAFFNQVKNIIL